MYARIYCIYHACMPAPSSSIMPGFCGRDNGHKALCPLSFRSSGFKLREQGNGPTPAHRSRYHREISALPLARQQELDHFGQVCTVTEKSATLLAL